MTPYSDSVPVRLYARGMGTVLAVAAGALVGAGALALGTWAWLARNASRWW